MKTLPLGDLLEVLDFYDWEIIYLSERLNQNDAPHFVIDDIRASMDLNDIRVKSINLRGCADENYNEFVIEDCEAVVDKLRTAELKRKGSAIERAHQLVDEFARRITSEDVKDDDPDADLVKMLFGDDVSWCHLYGNMTVLTWNNEN